jgi:hypothetical protein
MHFKRQQQRTSQRQKRQPQQQQQQQHLTDLPKYVLTVLPPKGSIKQGV